MEITARDIVKILEIKTFTCENFGDQELYLSRCWRLRPLFVKILEIKTFTSQDFGDQDFRLSRIWRSFLRRLSHAGVLHHWLHCARSVQGRQSAHHETAGCDEAAGVHTHTHIHIHLRIHIHIHTCVQTRTRAHTQTHTHTHGIPHKRNLCTPLRPWASIGPRSSSMTRASVALRVLSSREWWPE